jgi:hypothetical protein
LEKEGLIEAMIEAEGCICMAGMRFKNYQSSA